MMGEEENGLGKSVSLPFINIDDDRANNEIHYIPINRSELLNDKLDFDMCRLKKKFLEAPPALVDEIQSQYFYVL